MSCSLVATSTVTRSKQQLLLLCRDHGCVRLRAAACGCVRLRATTSGARTGACWCSQGVGRRELIFRVICSVCAHTSSCGAHLRHAPTHRRGLCGDSSAPQRRRQRPRPMPLRDQCRKVRGGGEIVKKKRLFLLLVQRKSPCVYFWSRDTRRSALTRVRTVVLVRARISPRDIPRYSSTEKFVRV